MKAINILKCVLWTNDTEGTGIINVPSETDEWKPQSEEWWLETFGAMPPAPLPEGKYFYRYTVGTSSDDWLYDGQTRHEPDGICEAGVNDYGETDYILMWRLDD